MTQINPQRLPKGTVAWILTAGVTGCEVQCLGVAGALGLEPIMKRVQPKPPGSWLAPWGPATPTAGVEAPWPDIVFACGRQTIPYARMIRRRSGGKSFVAVLQNPKVRPSAFDFVWVPVHDRLSGPNVLSTLISPHTLTRQKLAAAAGELAPRIAALPHPRVAVLLGGKNSVYSFDEAAAARLGDQLARLCDESHASLLVTPSRRTGEAQTRIIAEKLKGRNAEVWSGTGPNPYFAYLGSADAVLVTCDSVNMIGEAAFTGKPVHVIGLEGGGGKFRRFLDSIYAAGYARPFNGQLEQWDYTPPDTAGEIARTIERAYLARQKTTI